MIELTLAYHAYLYEQNEKRVEEQKKQHHYYVGNKDKIESYLDRALEITYDADDIGEMQKNYVNLTKKVIDSMAVVYSEPAVRYFAGKEDIEKSELLSDYYSSLMPDNLNAIDRKIHRYAKLSNVCLLLVLIDKTKKKIKYVVEPIYKYNLEFDEDDSGKITRLTYDKYYKDKNGEDELFTVVWTDKQHYKMDKLGNIAPFKDNPGMVNPYGIIPVCIMNFHNGDGFYGEGQNDLVNVNEQLNVLLTKVVSNDIIYGSEGTDVAINLGLSNKGTVTSDGSRKVRRGRKHPIVVENARTDSLAPPSFQHTTLDAKITEVRNFIDWYIKYIASMKGLNPSTVLTELKDTSDYQKMMDALGQIEMRKDDLEYCKIFELERYKITKLVWNTHAAELGMDEVKDDETKFKVDFAEIKIQETPQDKIAQREFELKYNLSTPAKWLMDENPDLTLEESQKLIKENKVFNTQIGSMTRTNLLFNNQRTNVNE